MRGIFSLDGPVGRALERFAALLGVSLAGLFVSAGDDRSVYGGALYDDASHGEE